MKKFFFTISFVLVAILANAVKIEKDEIDEFTGKRTVITSWEYMSVRSIHMRFRMQNDKIYLDFKFIPDQSIVIKENAPLLFKSATGDVTSFYSTDTFHGGLGDGAVGLMASGAWGIKATYTGNINWFANNILALIRVNASDGYYDRNVSQKEGEKIQRLYNLFVETIDPKGN